MSLIHDLSFLAVRPFLGEAGDALLAFVNDRFGDHTRRVTRALETSSERAWRSLEFALGEAAWWEQVPLSMAAREEQAFRAQVKAFLDSIPEVVFPGDPTTFRRRCLKELRGARKVGLVPGRGLAVDALAARGQALAGHADPMRHLEADRQAVTRLAGILRREGYGDLAQYVELRPANGEPLLVVSVRYFFRRELEGDPRLAATLAQARQERLSATLEAGLDGLHGVLKHHGEAAEELLTGMAGLVERTHAEVKQLRQAVEQGQAAVLATEAQMRDDVRALREQLEKQGKQIEELHQALVRVLEGEKGAPDSLRFAAGAPRAVSFPSQPPPRSGTIYDALPADPPGGAPPGPGKPLLSPLFTAGPPPIEPPAPVEGTAPASKRRRRLLSPLFDPPPGEKQN
jgi:hypothetical protein